MRIAVLVLGGAMLAAAAQAADDRKASAKRELCENMGLLVVDICRYDSQDELECIREDMEKLGLVEGKDYTVQTRQFACK